MSFELLGEQVAIIADPMESKTESGIHLPEGSGVDAKKPRYGTVAAVGTGRRSDLTGDCIPIEVEEGDRVFFHRMHDNFLEFEGQELLILRPHEIWGILHNDLRAVANDE